MVIVSQNRNCIDNFKDICINNSNTLFCRV